MTTKKETKKNETPQLKTNITDEQMKQLASQLVMIDGFIFKKSMLIEQLPLFLIAIDPTPKQAKFMSDLKLEIVDERGAKFFPKEEPTQSDKKPTRKRTTKNNTTDKEAGEKKTTRKRASTKKKD